MTGTKAKKEMITGRTEIAVSNMLRFGVMSSALLTLLGGWLYLLQHATDPVNFSKFCGASEQFRSVGAVLKEALRLDSKGIIQAGVLLLLATPIARVALSIFIFLKERDYVYVAVTLIVLFVLLYSLLGGKIQF